MATRSLSEVEYAEMIAAKSKYDRAAAAWVAQEVRKTVDWVEQYPEAPLLNPYYITDVTVKTVGDYHYSEMTFDEGDAGLSYTFWEPRVVAKGQHKGTTRLYPIEGFEIRWYGDGMNAGRFIEECVALLGKEE